MSNYVFPKFIAEMMAKVDQRTQYESSMLSMVFIMIGLVLSVVYAAIYMDFALWFKIVTVINAVFGLIFMGSYLITTYQQYLAYLNFQALQKAMTINVPQVPINNQKEVNQNETK